MSVIDWMQPRDHRSAARSISTLAGVAATTTVLTAPIDEEYRGAAAAAGAALLVLMVVGLAVIVHRLSPRQRLLWALGPMLSVSALVGIDLLTHDAGITAQIFFLFPALYGASQLPVRGAAVMAGLAVVGEAVVVFTQLPPGEALVDTWFVGAAIVTTAGLLSMASERHARLVRKLEAMAAIDPLTGLATRRVLDEAAASALSGAGNHLGTALVMIDVDHFKQINDRDGHPAGDAVLVQLAGLLLGHTRRTDVVCRMGGDEIAVLMPACDERTAIHRAEQILTAVRAHRFRTEDGRLLEISISMGCAHLPTHALDLRDLYAAADRALYRAKSEGRGQVARASAMKPGRSSRPGPAGGSEPAVS